MGAEMVQYKIDFESLPWESPAPGVKHKVYQHDGVQLRLLEFGRELEHPDWCTKGHIGYVLDGELEVTFADKVCQFVKGDGLFIPPGVEHKHIPKPITETVTLVLVEGV